MSDMSQKLKTNKINIMSYFNFVKDVGILFLWMMPYKTSLHCSGYIVTRINEYQLDVCFSVILSLKNVSCIIWIMYVPILTNSLIFFQLLSLEMIILALKHVLICKFVTQSLCL